MKLVRTDSEHFEHARFVTWFKMQYPGVLIWCVPNGSKLPPQTVGKLKSEGLWSGAPDLEIPAWNVFIEMKRLEGGKASPEQLATIEYLCANGKYAGVFHGCDQAIKFIESIPKPAHVDYVDPPPKKLKLKK
jgi:hypothetical protein